MKKAAIFSFRFLIFCVYAFNCAVGTRRNTRIAGGILIFNVRAGSFLVSAVSDLLIPAQNVGKIGPKIRILR